MMTVTVLYNDGESIVFKCNDVVIVDSVFKFDMGKRCAKLIPIASVKTIDVDTVEHNDN